jgi:hypothetical protein
MASNELKVWTEIVSSLATTAAILAAAWWFFVTTKYKQRIQFDIECNFLSLTTNRDFVIAELQFIFENKGFIEHRFYNLNVSVHSLESEDDLKEKDNTKELLFKKQLLPKVSIVPEQFGYYFVRSDARQVITHIIKVPISLSVVRVTASFDYSRGDKYPHTTRRVFRVCPI